MTLSIINWSVAILMASFFTTAPIVNGPNTGKAAATAEASTGCPVVVPDGKSADSPEYYKDSLTGEYRIQEPGGSCESAPPTSFCTYLANRDNPDPLNDSHFDPVPSTQSKVWEP